MRIAVFGSGGAGGYFGARLAQARQEVVFIARGAHLDAMRSGGLRIESITGNFCLDRVEATDDPRQVGEVDCIICGVKAWQVVTAARAMRPMVGANTLVIPLQNGVEAPAQLAEILDKDTVLGGMCTIIALRAGAGWIKHIGANPLIRFGHMDKHPDPRVNALSEIFNRCQGIKSSIPEDIQVAMWQKFMLIGAWSGVGALTRAPIGILLKQSETRDIIVEAMQEIYSLALARNIDLPKNSIEKTIATLESFPPNSTASMQRDIADGLPSELDNQNGAVVRLASDSGVDTPINKFILYSLRSLELKARGALRF